MKKELIRLRAQIKLLELQSFLPLPQKLKQPHLRKIEKLVSHYQPGLEERTGIKLGEVKVKDYTQLALDQASKPGNLVLFPIFYLVSNFDKKNISMSYNTNTVYVNFNRYVNFMLLTQNRVDFQDRHVVHELSHGLWEKLRGSEEYHPAERVWNEGFATYCADEYFRDLMPGIFNLDDYRSIKRNSVYDKGFKKVSEAVKRYGVGIILDIPKKFKELDAEFNIK
jgi:hypothetical protein